MLKKFLLALAIALLPLTASAQTQELTLVGYGGELSAILQTPDGRAKFPMVIICHGFTGKKEEPLLAALAKNLEGEGIASIRFDFNGHGQSYGAFQSMTVPNEIEDAKKVYEWVSKLDEVTSIGVAGHSQGGVVTGMLAGELGAKKIKAVVLMAPAAVLRDDALRGNMFGFKFNSLKPPQFVEIFDGHKVGREYIVTAQNLPIYETTENFTGPALMIHGTGDIVVPYTYSLSYKKILRRGEVELVDGADHSFTGKEKRIAKSAADFFARHLK